MSKIFVLCIALFFGGLILIQLQSATADETRHKIPGITFQMEAFSTNDRVKNEHSGGGNESVEIGIDRISLEETMMPKNSNEWGLPQLEPFYTKNNTAPGKSASTAPEVKPLDPAVNTGYCRITRPPPTPTPTPTQESK